MPVLDLHIHYTELSARLAAMDSTVPYRLVPQLAG